MEKARGEEKNLNWIKAAILYGQAKEEYLKDEEVELAANACYRQGYTYTRCAETAGGANEFEEHFQSSIESYNEAADLFSWIDALPEKWACLAESAFSAAFISKSIPEMLEAFENAYELFLEANKGYSIRNDTKHYIRTYVRAAMTLSNLIPYRNNPDEINRVRQEGREIIDKIWNIAIEQRDAFSLSQSLFADHLLKYYEWFIGLSKKDHYWKRSEEETINKLEEAIPIIEANDNPTYLEMSYHVAGLTNNTYGFQFVENDKEQNKFAELGFSYFRRAESLNKKTKNKLLNTLTTAWTDWWALFWGRVEYLQNRIQDDLAALENNAKIMYQSFTNFNFYANFLPTFAYANFAQRSFFSSSQRRQFAEMANKYALECLRIIPSSPISLWPLQMQTWAYSQLTILASDAPERQMNARIMLQYAERGENFAKNYEGGFARASAFSSLYRCYKTLAEISKDEEYRIEYLTKAIDAMEKYADYALESRVGVINAQFRIGLLYGELYEITGQSNLLKKLRDLFQSILNDCNERGYFSYSAAASENLAHIEDKLGNFNLSTDYYVRAREKHTQSLEKIEYRPLREKIVEKINYTNAWALIESAKTHHKREDQQKAEAEYLTASKILINLPDHSYEAPYFEALALQEKAEYLSSKENYQNSQSEFLKGQMAFTNALNAFNQAIKDIDNNKERDRINKMISLTNLGISYCSARSSIDNAQILWKKGDLIPAAEQMKSAASLFKETPISSETRREQRKFNAFNYLCQAWENMITAEKYADSEKYQSASGLFKSANDLLLDSRIKFLASGNAFFCQSLANGCKFDESNDLKIKEELFIEIKSLLRNAAILYQKGDFITASGWVLATSTYFDATWHLIKADKEIELDKKQTLLRIGSSYLKSAAGLFRKHGFVEKENEVQTRISMVEKEEQILVTAINTIKEPSISRSTKSMSSSTNLGVSSLPSGMSEIRKFTEEARRVSILREYQLIYEDNLPDFPRSQKRHFKVGIAQIGISNSGDFLNEFYDRKNNGLIRLKQNKIEFMRSKVNDMITRAHANEVDILIFPELSIDLNYEILYNEILNLSKSYGMYIIPGSYHDESTKYNQSVVIGPDGILWRQNKHIPAVIHLDGRKVTEEIDVGGPVHKTLIFNTEYGRIAIAICRDFLDMDLRVELKNSKPPVDLIINPAFTPVTEDFKAAHFDARRSIYAYCFFANVAEFGNSLIFTPEKERKERIMPPKKEGIIIKEVDLFTLRSERKRWENERRKTKSFIQSTR
ncbi:MAG: carbon-nitrogen hydrolase family protein [Candidatus Thorarchaeota archaeon]